MDACRSLVQRRRHDHEFSISLSLYLCVSLSERFVVGIVLELSGLVCTNPWANIKNKEKPGSGFCEKLGAARSMEHGTGLLTYQT